MSDYRARWLVCNQDPDLDFPKILKSKFWLKSMWLAKKINFSQNLALRVLLEAPVKAKAFYIILSSKCRKIKYTVDVASCVLYTKPPAAFCTAVKWLYFTTYSVDKFNFWPDQNMLVLYFCIAVYIFPRSISSPDEILHKIWQAAVSYGTCTL